MNNLTTRKIVLGMLMMLVLAFSVQGTADAQTLSGGPDSTSVGTAASQGTLVIYSSDGTENRSFTFQVNGAEDGNTITIGNSSITGVVNVTIGNIKVDVPDAATGDSGDGGGVSNGVITFDAPDLDLNGDGDATDILSEVTDDKDYNGDGDKLDTAISEAATEDPGWTWSGSITVEYTTSNYGLSILDVTDTGADDGDDSDHFMIRTYVVRDNNQALDKSIITSTPTTPMRRISSITIDTDADQWTQVNLRISGGKFVLTGNALYLTSNRIFEASQRREFTANLAMFTSSDGAVTASVEPNPNQIATITATIPGSREPGREYVLTSFDNAVVIEKTSGDNQIGPTTDGYSSSHSDRLNKDRLSNALVVRVTDGYGTNRGIGNQWVEFSISEVLSPTQGDPFLRATSRGLLWNHDADANGLITNADDNRPTLTVKTDGSGYARVYFVPGNDPEEYTVDCRVVHQQSPSDYATTGYSLSQPFTVNVIQRRDAVSTFVIDKDNSTSTPQIYTFHKAMNVKVGTTANVKVNFSITGGEITRSKFPPDYDTLLSTVTNNTGVATVYVKSDGNSTVKVRAWIDGRAGVEEATHVVTYFQNYVHLERVSDNEPEGVKGTQLQDPLVIKVTDGSGGNPVSGQVIKFYFPGTQLDNFDPDAGGPLSSITRQFVPVPGTTVFVTAREGDTLSAADNTDTLRPADQFKVDATSTRPNPGAVIFVETDSDGEAEVYLLLGTGTSAMDDGSHSIRADMLLSNDYVSFRATAIAASAAASIEIVSGDSQSAEANTYVKDPLVVIVKDLSGGSVRGYEVRFTTDSGALSNPRSRDPGENPAPIVTSSLRGIKVYTDRTGKASIRYNVGDEPGSKRVFATITAYDGETRRKTFNINGSGGQQQQQQQQQQTTTRTITIVPSSIDGEPGEEVDITLIPSPSAVVILDSGELDDSDFSRLFGTGTFTVTLTLPDEEDEYEFFATSPGYTPATATVTVESEEVAEGTLSIETLDAPANGQQTIRINVRDSEGVAPTVPVDVTLTGTGINRTVPTTRGSGAAVIAVPNTVSVSAEGYRSDTITLTGTGQTTTPPATTPPATTPPAVTASEPDSISIVGPSTRSGTVNEELDAALIVRVLDDDGDAVEDARVIFRVRKGRGRLSQRGNGRAIAVQTDSSGYARADFTPLSEGTITVEAETTGVTRTVTFTITTGSAPPTETPGTGVTPGTTVSPVVHVGAAKRPSMLWVDGGAIYALVGADPQEFAPSVDNAMNIAVGGGKVYWTEKTGESGGTINSANLNGDPGVTELASIFATPIGIAVDAAGSKLYWTNSAGRIQSANLNGSGITNVLQNLDNPMDIALAGGNVYWTQGTGSVRFVNLRGQKVVRNISTGLDTPGSLVIGGGKVYWTEMTGESGGTINSANLNGTGAMELASILAVPMGIAVDTARSKLYWTNSRGRIQSANLDGSKIQNVVDGLGSPGELVLSNSIAAPTTTTPTTTRTPTTASKYDVNGDGSVDNADASLVAAAMNTSNTKYDVNGDGTVNFLDLLLVFDNRDPGAAGAPTLVGMQLSAVQIDRIEEQIDLLIATNDRSPAAMRTLIYLQQLIVTARPEKTQLLANYPNPFNPETWIPYELATDTNVRITIYNPQGVVIRTLQLGQQSAGYYTGRDRAAYWDGRNALGEQVASGLYFYQFETDDDVVNAENGYFEVGKDRKAWFSDRAFFYPM